MGDSRAVQDQLAQLPPNLVQLLPETRPATPSKTTPQRPPTPFTQLSPLSVIWITL
ncbi:hypothetical protein GCM10008983_09580 [Lentibacillus halophilus]|uniref:Uncharacterized protein n=1 Tax=Lentibacillus halophilus TaxID=295065 RepID=A0ABN0Z5W0_9BACI